MCMFTRIPHYVFVFVINYYRKKYLLFRFNIIFLMILFYLKTFMFLWLNSARHAISFVGVREISFPH